MSILDRVKWWLWHLGIPGEWLFRQHRPAKWWDDFWLRYCDLCDQMIHQGDGPDESPEPDGCYLCQQCGGPYPRKPEISDSVGADGEGQS